MNRCLLDLRGLVLHAFYRGDKTAAGAVNQFIDFYLTDILKDFAPIQIIGVLEGSGSNTRRRSMLATYKDKPEQDANDELVMAEKAMALETCQRILLAIGCLLVQTPYAEADDTLAYLVERLKGHKTLYTVDGDMMALYRPDLTIMYADRQTGSVGVKDDFKGLPLEHVPASMVRLYKSIVGDNSDGIPGVKGCGPTFFTKLAAAQGWDNLEVVDECLAANDQSPLQEVGCPLINKLLESWSDWRRSWHLAKLHDEWMELCFSKRVIRPKWGKRVPEMPRLVLALQPLGLAHRAYEFEPYMVTRQLHDADTWAATDFNDLIDQFGTGPIVAFDWESYDYLQHAPFRQAKSTFVDVRHQKLTGGSFCYGPNLQHSFYLSVKHRDTKNVDKAELRALLEYSEHLTRVAHNASFEEVVAKNDLDYDFPLDSLPQDTMIAASYVDENGDGGLKKLSKHWLNYDQTNYRDVVPEGKDMRDVSGKEVMAYGADDSIVTAHLWVVLGTIAECEGTLDFMMENEPFFDIALQDGYLKGTPIDFERMAELAYDDDQAYEAAEKELRELLETHASDYNEAGFKTLWPEIEQYQRAVMKSKEKSPEEIDTALDAQYINAWEQSRYVPFEPRPIVFEQKLVSLAARLVGLASIRSLRQQKLEDWIASMELQRDEQKIEFTEQQTTFIEALRSAAPYLQFVGDSTDQIEVEWLRTVMTKILHDDKSTWQGTELNTGSPLQMGHLFYSIMGLPIIIRNPVKNKEGVRSVFDLEGAPSSNELAIQTWLISLDQENDWRFRALELVLKIRGIKQRRSLYYKPYPLWEDPETGHIHPSIRNCGTITRRPSGSSPNPLQVSKHKDEGRMRSCFLALSNPLEREVVFSCDYSQEELRLMAAASGDHNMTMCYVGDNKRDVHTMTATGIINFLFARDRKPLWTYEDYVEVLSRDKKDPTRQYAAFIRDKRGKPTAFLMAYVGSAIGLARKLIVPIEIAEGFVDGFFRTYPGVKTFQEDTIRFAQKHGFVVTPFGNRKHCDRIHDKDGGIASGEGRGAVNYLMQGTAADILKIALRRYVEQGVRDACQSTLFYPVYDELMGSVPLSKLYDLFCRLTDIMEMQVPNSDIMLELDCSFGPNWGQQIEVGFRPTREKVEEAIDKFLTSEGK